MALLVTSVFGVTGCGSDDDVQVESRVKNVAPEASGASGGPSESDCDIRDLLDALLDPSFDLSDLSDLLDPSFALVPLYDVYADQCNAWIESGADSVTTTTVPPAPEASGASDVPSEVDCPTLGDFLDRLYLLDVIDGSNQKRGLLDILDRLDLIDRSDYDDLGDYNINLLDLDRNDRFDQLLGADAWYEYCDNAPEGDDVDGG
jgi:hypothetical protein